MIIDVTEQIESVGWATVMADAPEAVAKALREASAQGLPVCAGRVAGPALSPVWVAVDYSSGKPLVIARAAI